jgi:hypothetical protein
MCSRLSAREKLILLNPRNSQPRIFRIEWQLLSVSATRKFARLEMLFGRTGSRSFAGAPPFYPEPRRACPACPACPESRRECRREPRRVVFSNGILKFVTFLISGVPTVIPSEQALVRARANSRIRARDLLFAALEGAASERVS